MPGCGGVGVGGPVSVGLEEAVVVGLRFINCCMGGIIWMGYCHVITRFVGGGGLGGQAEEGAAAQEGAAPKTTEGERRGERVKALSLQTMGSGQVQCTSRRNFAPFSSSTFRDI